LENIGGLVTSDDYFRLLDWALWLKFLRNGFIGHPISGCSFVAEASKGKVSSGSQEDYILKHRLVTNDFVIPILKELHLDTQGF
jgi:hypothetical protein